MGETTSRACRGRFHERVARYRRDAVVLSSCGIVLIIIVVPFFMLYLTLHLPWLVWETTINFLPTGLSLWLAAVALFFACGYAGYRKSSQVDDESWTDMGNSLGLLTLSAGLVFFLGAEIIRCRHFFSSREIEDLAFTLITQPGAGVTRDAVDRHFRAAPEQTRMALKLLLEMRFLKVWRRDDEYAFVRTIRCEEFLRVARNPARGS